MLPLAVCACGGFITPEQPVTVGFALSSPSIPPRYSVGGDELVLSRLQVHLELTARHESDAGGEEPLGPLNAFDAALDRRWLAVSSAPLARGRYSRLELRVSQLAIEGTWNGSPFRVGSPDSRTQEVWLSMPWRVELGNETAASLVTDPIRWMAEVDGQAVRLIAPADDKASSELIDRFFDSLSARQDDDRDGLPDP